MFIIGDLKLARKIPETNILKTEKNEDMKIEFEATLLENKIEEFSPGDLSFSCF